MAVHEASIAVRRFGLGPKPGDLARVGGDPRGYVLAALDTPAAAILDGEDLDPSHETFVAVREAQRQLKRAREAKPGEAKPGGAMSAGAPGSTASTMAPAGGGEPMSPQPQPKPGKLRREAFHEEAAARFHRALVTNTPLIERLVYFWSNHFCVSAAKGMVRGLAGAFEREAIRPHVLGRFADMLKAVEQHPAMLLYLDNQLSVGPASKAGLNRGRGLNENLAREILELHTLGADGGYTQQDVTNLARIITGWTVGGLDQDRFEPGRFAFTPNRHEPGRWPILGQAYGGEGVHSGERLLADLARHPSTARHVSAKLARHFVGDAAPPALAVRLAKVFRDTDGDLGQVTRALVTAPEAWTAPMRKIVPPFDFVVAVGRASEQKPNPGEAMRLAGVLGQPLWMPPSPKGWPDGDDAWTGPAAVRERLRIAEKTTREFPRGADPRQVAAALFGEHLSEPSRSAIARAETREQGFELLVMTPEFQRR